MARHGKVMTSGRPARVEVAGVALCECLAFGQPTLCSKAFLSSENFASVDRPLGGAGGARTVYCSGMRVSPRATSQLLDKEIREFHAIAPVKQDDRTFGDNAADQCVIHDRLVIELHRQVLTFECDVKAVPFAGFLVS